MGNTCFKNSLVNKVTIDGNIKTVVITVMENRSFDNVLGFFNRTHPSNEVNGLTGNEYNLINVSDPTSQKVYITDTEPYVTEADPDHGFDAIKFQVFGSSTDTSANPPPMNGFAQSAEGVKAGFSPQVMSAFKPEAIPVTVALAQEFAVFDKWHASLPASTQPNRFYVHSATSHGLISNVTADLIDGNPQKTLFESVDEVGLTFGIYYQQVPSTLFYSRLRNPKYIGNFLDYDLFFKSHAASGSLPNYTVIEQRYFDLPLLPANDNHPPHDVTSGEKFIKEVYETLRASPQWNEMVWVITYDEHGGFYDHVPTPVTGVPNPDGIKGPAPDYFNFDRLGVRVPTIIVSPWVEKGSVVHEATGPTSTSQYEHSSIPATVKKIFKLPNFLTARDAWAGTFEGVFTTRTTPRTDCPVTLPDVPSSTTTTSTANTTTTKTATTTTTSKSINLKEDASEKVLHEWQEELMLLASLLKGELGKLPEVTSESQANDYVHSAVDSYLKT